MRSRSAGYHISSSVDIHARTSVHQTEVPLHPDLLTLLGLPSLQTVRQTESLRSFRLFRLQTVQMAGHTCGRLWSRLHQMQVQYELHRYHRSVLHRYRRSQNVLSYVVCQPHLLHTGIMVRIPYIPDRFLCKFPALHKLVSLRFPVFQGWNPAEPLPYNKYIRLLLLLSHKFHPDSHKVPH